MKNKISAVIAVVLIIALIAVVRTLKVSQPGTQPGYTQEQPGENLSGMDKIEWAVREALKNSGK